MRSLESRLMQLTAEVASLRTRLDDLDLEPDEVPMPPPAEQFLDEEDIAVEDSMKRFHVLHSRIFTNVNPPVGSASDISANLLRFTVTSGSWWRDGTEYTWTKGVVYADAFAAGKYFIVAKLIETGEPAALACVVELVAEDDMPPKDDGDADLEQADYRIIAAIYASGSDVSADVRIWQRWFSDIYDGGTTFPSDWELERNTYQDSGKYYVDIGAGHFHWHGHLVKTIDDTTQLLVDTGTGYIYLSYEVATNTLSVVYTVDFPESTSEVWNFMLYKFENGRVVRDLRTSINFGSPI